MYVWYSSMDMDLQLLLLLQDKYIDENEDHDMTVIYEDERKIMIE
jgi:hypothetical protein